MVVSKPSIFLYTFAPDCAIIKEICAGIEEEGVLYEVFERKIDSLSGTENGEILSGLAYEAAKDSILGSGIGLTGRWAALQLRPLPRGKHVFELRNASMEAYRKLGANSARAIKKLPFKEG